MAQLLKKFGAVFDESLLLQAATRGFESRRHLTDFFDNPSFKLTVEQERIQQNVMYKYQPTG